MKKTPAAPAEWQPTREAIKARAREMLAKGLHAYQRDPKVRAGMAWRDATYWLKVDHAEALRKAAEPAALEAELARLAAGGR